MKEKFLWASILLIILSWTLNYFYFRSHQLEKPIFVDHYYEAYMENEAQLTFYYLTNKQNPLEVNYVTIDGLEIYPINQGFFVEESITNYNQEFRHHYLKSVTLQFRKDLLQLDDEHPNFYFERMKVFFHDGSSISAKIGKVNLFSNHTFLGPFESRVSSSGSNHRNDTWLITKEPVNIVNITLPYSNDISEAIAVKVDLNQEKLKEFDAINKGEDFPKWNDGIQDLKWENAPGISIKEKGLFPFKLKEDDWMHLSLYFKQNKKSFYEINLRIQGKDKTGEPFVQIVPTSDQPFFNQQDIDKIIDEKEGEK